MESNLDYVCTEFDKREKEIAPGVFLVYREHLLCNDVIEQHTRGEDLYLYMDYSTAEKTLSIEAIKAGDADGSRLYYSAPYRYTIPLHELLTNCYITDYDIIRLYDMEEAMKDGRYYCPDYFGELERAKSSRDDSPVRSMHISNGIDAFLYTDGGVELAVHEIAAFYDLSDIAECFGIKHGSCYHYLNETCAIPIYELSDTYPGLKVLVDDEAAMLNTIKNNFPAYVLSINSFTHEPELW